MFVRKDAGDTYKIVALKTFLVAHIDDPVIRAVVRYKPMYRKTLLKQLISVASVVDVKIMHELLGEKCALGFDGFTDTADHAIAVFAASKNDIRLLAFFPFLDEASMAAAVHIEFLDMVLDRYNLAIHMYELRWSGCYRVLKRIKDLQPYMHLFMDDSSVEDDNSDGDDATTNPNTEILGCIPLVTS
ncbi:hypothetical protein PInf_018494 [Phytophthora infestans]|nr:hypothetical protein PInf_018494 [Phytophthora infestans]